MGSFGYVTTGVHLVVVQDNESADEARWLAREGRFGCDYAWNDDFPAYVCMPHRWIPGSDESYALYQAGDYGNDDDGAEEPDGTSFDATDVAGHSPHDRFTGEAEGDEIPF